MVMEVEVEQLEMDSKVERGNEMDIDWEGKGLVEKSEMDDVGEREIDRQCRWSWMLMEREREK